MENILEARRTPLFGNSKAHITSSDPYGRKGALQAVLAEEPSWLVALGCLFFIDYKCFDYPPPVGVNEHVCLDFTENQMKVKGRYGNRPHSHGTAISGELRPLVESYVYEQTSLVESGGNSLDNDNSSALSIRSVMKAKFNPKFFAQFPVVKRTVECGDDGVCFGSPPSFVPAQFVYLHVQKTGGTSVINWLAEVANHSHALVGCYWSGRDVMPTRVVNFGLGTLTKNEEYSWRPFDPSSELPFEFRFQKGLSTPCGGGDRNKDPKKAGPHAALFALPLSFRTAMFVVASIRSPWGYYVSLWSYGSEGHGGAHNRASDKASGHNVTAELDWVYGDTGDPRRFQYWLRAKHNSSSIFCEKQDSCEMMGDWTKRLTDSTRFDPGELKIHDADVTEAIEDKRQHQFDFLVDRMRAQNHAFFDVIIRTEHLAQDFGFVLALYESKVKAKLDMTSKIATLDRLFRNIRSKEQYNPSHHRSWRAYFDDAALSFVDAIDGILMRALSYSVDTGDAPTPIVNFSTVNWPGARDVLEAYNVS